MPMVFDESKPGPRELPDWHPLKGGGLVISKTQFAGSSNNGSKPTNEVGGSSRAMPEEDRKAQVSLGKKIDEALAEVNRTRVWPSAEPTTPGNKGNT